MPTGRSEPIHFGFRFGAQDGVGFRKLLRGKRSSRLRPKDIPKDTNGDDSMTATLCNGYAPSGTGRTTILCDERAPLLGDTGSPSEIASGTTVICDGRPRYAESERSTTRSSFLSPDRREHILLRSHDHRPPIPSRQDPRSRIENWTTDVRTQSEGSPSLGVRSEASFASDSNAAAHSVSSSGESQGEQAGYRSPFVSKASGFSTKTRRGG